jgi:hypothetical protein
VLGAFLAWGCAARGTQAAEPRSVSPGAAAGPSAVERLLQPGPEAQALARRAGSWDVVMTIRPTPDAEPIETRGLVAERRMIGLYLNEVMRPAPGTALPDFQRIDYLTWDAVQRRWAYVSMDTRFPVGIMHALGYGAAEGSEIEVEFDLSALPGWGEEIEGRLLRTRHVSTRESDDRDLTRQYWTQPGLGEWLAVTYEYQRRH